MQSYVTLRKVTSRNSHTHTSREKQHTDGKDVVLTVPVPSTRKENKVTVNPDWLRIIYRVGNLGRAGQGASAKFVRFRDVAMCPRNTGRRTEQMKCCLPGRQGRGWGEGDFSFSRTTGYKAMLCHAMPELWPRCQTLPRSYTRFTSITSSVDTALDRNNSRKKKKQTYGGDDSLLNPTR